MPLPKWGGCPFSYAPGCSRMLPSPAAFLPFIVANFQTIRAKRGKSEFFFGVLWCFLGIFGDQRGQNLRYILVLRVAGASCVALHLGRWWCPLGAGGRAFEASGPAGGCSGPLVACSVALSALSLCSWCIVLEICLYSRFKGVFSAVWGCCVGLCCLEALRGLCGFVRVNS